MNPVAIDTRAEYDYCVARGYEPLIDRRFKMDIRLRVSVQRELFGDGHSTAENEKFYRWCWEHKLHICEECMRPLREYSATYVSHILTRAAHPEMAHDCRNINILCFNCHNRWEHANTRFGMRIELNNQRIIEGLKREYNQIL